MVCIGLIMLPANTVTMLATAEVQILRARPTLTLSLSLLQRRSELLVDARRYSGSNTTRDRGHAAYILTWGLSLASLPATSLPSASDLCYLDFLLKQAIHTPATLPSDIPYNQQSDSADILNVVLASLFSFWQYGLNVLVFMLSLEAMKFIIHPWLLSDPDEKLIQP